MDLETKERIALKKGMAKAKASLMKFKKFYDERLPDEGTDAAVQKAKEITPGE